MTRLVKTLEELGISPRREAQLARFIDIFEKWNKRINLSAARSRDEILEQVIDSLHVVPFLQTSRRVLDVGSGGGFPVVVAAICLPETSFVALEPVHKKHAFLRTAARELSLVNLDALAQRLDDHTVADYDVAMSRATFDLHDWLALGQAHVCTDGIVIGFEALTRADIGDIERHAYSMGDKTRAIVIRHVPRETGVR